jgi:phospholipase C
MKSILLAVLPLIAFVCVANAESVRSAEAEKKTNKTPIEHVVILMLENRSFDHMLGLLKKQNPEIKGCLPGEEDCSNPDDPTAENPTMYTVDDTAVYSQASPSHSISGTTAQIYGTADGTEAKMNGFISSYTRTTGSVESGAGIMKCFAPEHIPVLTSLAMDYLTFDGWYAGVPGPTMPNRAYAAASTSHGMGTSNIPMIVGGLPSTTMFRQLLEMGLDYRIYFEQVPALLMFKDLRHKDARPRYGGLKRFYADVAEGNLPELTWIEPAYYNVENWKFASDQHPDHDVSRGDQLIKDIYESLRNSSLWNTTALIITYDEHGGFFDHVAPPVNVPAPDGINSTDDPFDFTRLGVRVPTVVVSPWVEKGAVVHATAEGEGQFEHSSFPATIVHKLFAPKLGHPEPKYQNNRDVWAATFESIFTAKTTIREDCPLTMPMPSNHANLTQLAPMDGSLKLTDLQKELLLLAAGITHDESFRPEWADHWTESQAGNYVTSKMAAYLDIEI